MLKWLGATSQSDKQHEIVESPSRTFARSGGPEETDTGRARGSLHRGSDSASYESASDKQSISDQPGSSGTDSSAREQARQSRKRPLADPDGSDTEDASVPEPAPPAPAAAASRKARVPSRPSGAGSSARPPGKPTSPEALPRSMGLPAQAMPVRPSQRDTAAAGQPGQADPKGAAEGPEKKPTLRQTYNTQADPEKQPNLSHNSASGGSGHYDPNNQMILRLEYLTESDVKWGIFLIHMSEFVGLVTLVLYLVAKLRTDDNYFIRDNTLVIINLCFGVLLWLALMEVFVIYIQHMVRAIRLRRQWSGRRYKSTVLLMVETVTQVVNLCFFILPNAYVLARPCGWRDPIVLWSNFVIFSCWNTLFLTFVVRVHNHNLWLDKDGQPRGGRSDATIVDAPWIIHAPKLLLWAAAEAFKATAIVIIIKKTALRPYYIPPETASDCRTWLYECHHDSIVQVMLILESAALLIYLVLFLYYLARSFRQLSVRNFRDFRMGNQSVRLILRTRLGAIIFFAACLVVFYYVGVGSCATWISSALGYLPMHIVLTAITMVMLYWFMPKDPDEQDQVLQAWLQEFAWTEAEKLQKWKTRAGNLRLTSAALHDLNKEPMFCFESAIKLYYYSHIIYQYHKLEGFKFSGGPDEKKDEVTHIGMFRRQLAKSFGHLRSRSNTGPTMDASAAGERSQNDLSRDSSTSAGIYRDASAQNLAEGPVTDSNLATGPNPGATAAKLKPTAKASSGNASRGGSTHGGKGNNKRSWGQSQAEDLSLDTALRLYGLERMEVLWERRLDTMALIAWGANRIVVVFRGTNSLKNVLADLEAWQTAFPPNQTGRHFWESPSVHNGFYQSYTANDFGKKIVHRVCELVSSHDWDWTKIYCTGHSLGGALALLAAYDISRAMEWVSKPTKVICYTFGAPRVGNHAFAHTYDRMVPETWNIVNDQDAVARRCKMCFLYKRPGQRVIINRRGDMLVRPTFIELTLNQTPFSSSVHDHFLLSYRDALAEICRAQMNRKKRLEGGLAGVLSLLEGDEFVRGILEPAGLTMEDLARPSIDAHRKVGVPPPPTDGPIPSKRAPSLGAPLPPSSPFQAAMPEPEQDEGIELQQRPSLERSSSSSASSYKTAYAQSFVSMLSTDDVTLPSAPSLGSARPSGDTDISMAATAHTKSGTISDTARHTEASDQSAASKANAPADSMSSSAEGGRSTAHQHLNGHGPHPDSKGSDEGMEHSLGLNEVRGLKGSFPGFWKNSNGENAAAAGIAAAAAAGAAGVMARKDTSHAQGPEPSSRAAPADSSLAAAEPPPGPVQAGELQRPHDGSNARAAGASPSTNTEHKGEHDLMVATGYTGPSGLLRRRDGMSGQQAIEELLKAQRTGSSVAPEVRIAAAYALANGAADAKRRRDAKFKALKTAQRQASNADVGTTANISAEASAGAPGLAAGAAASDIDPSSTSRAAFSEDSSAVTSGGQHDDMAELARPAEDTGSPQRSARALDPQPNTPHPYRINPEFYRAGSGGSPTVRFSDADAATAGAADGDSAVPLPGHSHRLAGSGMQPTGEDSSDPLERRSGSWLGWLPWSRAAGSPRAADALSSAERGERSSTGPGAPVSAARTGSGSPRADAATAAGRSDMMQSSRPGNAEPGTPFHSAGADVASSAATSSSAGPPKGDVGNAAGHIGVAQNGLSSAGYEEPTHIAGQSKAASAAVSSIGVSDRAASPSEPLESEAAQPRTATPSSRESFGGGLEATSVSRSPHEAASASSSAQAGLSLPAAQRAPSTPSQEPSSTDTGTRETSSVPDTPERAEAPRKGAPTAEPDQAQPISAADQASEAAAATAAAAGTRSSPAASLEADAPAEADAGSSQAMRNSANSPYRELSYSAFYPEEPEQSSSQGAWHVRDTTEDPLTAGEGSLSLWGREAVQPRVHNMAAASPQQTPSDSAGASLQQRPADADVASAQPQRPFGAIVASSEQSMAPSSEMSSKPGWRGARPDKQRGTRSEGEEHFVAVPGAQTQGGAASQQSDAATPFRFMGSESAPSTPTRSLKKKSGRRSSLLSSSSPRREGSQDLSIFSPSRDTQDAGSEEDVSPRTRAMSRYLSGKLGSSGLPSPAQSRAATPEEPQAKAAALETPPWAAKDAAAAAEDSSPPRIRRKATPRELAEQFRGHGLKQAEWAPIPIYWAKDGSPAAAPDAVQREL